MFQEIVLYVGLGIYCSLNIICAIINMYIMWALLKKLNLLLMTIMAISILRVIAVTVYTFYKGNHFGALNDFEFMLILSFTELVPVILIITSFLRYMNREDAPTEYSGNISSNIQDVKESIARTNTIVTSSCEMNDDTRYVIFPNFLIVQSRNLEFLRF